MNPNVKISEKIAVLATMDPVSVAAGTVVSGYVSMRDFASVAALLMVGAMGANGTIDAKLRQATSSAGAGAKDITGKAITQLLAASNSPSQVLIECRADDLDVNNAYEYVALSVTVGTAASVLGAVLLGGNGRFQPATAFNQTAVAQVI